MLGVRLAPEMAGRHFYVTLITFSIQDIINRVIFLTFQLQTNVCRNFETSLFNLLINVIHPQHIYQKCCFIWEMPRTFNFISEQCRRHLISEKCGRYSISEKCGRHSISEKCGRHFTSEKCPGHFISEKCGRHFTSEKSLRHFTHSKTLPIDITMI